MDMLPTRQPATHPCDRCGNTARIRAILPAAGELVFCGDHLLEHLTRLRELDANIQRLR